MTQLTDYLYLGADPKDNIRSLKKLGITCIINCAVEIPPLTMISSDIDGMDYLKIGIEDYDDYDIKRRANLASNLISKHRAMGGKTYVHCVAGVNRSPTICAWYMISELGMTSLESLVYISERRPIIDPLPGFVTQLFNRYKEIKSSKT